jgi:NADH-quinone oxidoreductase subunit J
MISPTPIDLLFYIFAGLGILFAFMVVLGRNPISAAFSLIGVFFSVAACYVLLRAHFLAAIQILVYAGAIMVLFIFVIMLLNADTRTFEIRKSRLARPIAGGLIGLLTVGLIWLIQAGTFAATKAGFTPEKIDALGGNVQVLSEVLFSDFILPFELTSVLLLVAMVGSVALAKRKQSSGGAL